MMMASAVFTIQVRDSYEENPLINPVRNQIDWIHVKERLCELNGRRRQDAPSYLMNPGSYHLDLRVKWNTLVIPLVTIRLYQYYETTYYSSPLITISPEEFDQVHGV